MTPTRDAVPRISAGELVREPRRVSATVTQAVAPGEAELTRFVSRTGVTGRPDHVQIGILTELRVTVCMERLDRLGGEWKFDPALPLYRSVVAVATRLSAEDWRMREALPLTPFGIWGPTLDVGDVVEIGTLHFFEGLLARRVSRARPWQARFMDVPEGAVERPEVVRILHELHEAGGSWVLVGDGLLVQFPRLPQETMPSPAASQRISRLRTLLQE